MPRYRNQTTTEQLGSIPIVADTTAWWRFPSLGMDSTRPTACREWALNCSIAAPKSAIVYL